MNFMKLPFLKITSLMLFSIFNISLKKIAFGIVLCLSSFDKLYNKNPSYLSIGDTLTL
jgi:hypothetical protein